MKQRKPVVSSPRWRRACQLKNTSLLPDCIWHFPTFNYLHKTPFFQVFLHLSLKPHTSLCKNKTVRASVERSDTCDVHCRLSASAAALSCLKSFIFNRSTIHKTTKPFKISCQIITNLRLLNQAYSPKHLLHPHPKPHNHRLRRANILPMAHLHLFSVINVDFLQVRENLPDHRHFCFPVVLHFFVYPVHLVLGGDDFYDKLGDDVFPFFGLPDLFFCVEGNVRPAVFACKKRVAF